MNIAHFFRATFVENNELLFLLDIPVNIYLLKVNNKNMGKVPQQCRFGVFIAYFKPFSGAYIVLFEQ